MTPMCNPRRTIASLNQPGGQADPFNLDRFIEAQEEVYAHVLAELRRGRKETHWMWFIFPQLAGLGHSPTSQYYAIKSLVEARQYLEQPVLGKRALECAELLLQIQGRSASQIFDPPDDLKLRSSMTLFAYVTGPGSVFARVLEKYFHGKPDERTLELLEQI